MNISKTAVPRRIIASFPASRSASPRFRRPGLMSAHPMVRPAAPDMMIYWGERIPLLSRPEDYGGLLYLTYYGFTKAPAGFIPTQDKGYLLVNLQLPDATSLENTQRVMQRIEKLAIKVPGVKHTLSIAGQSLLLNANAPNFGSMYVMLDDFHHRSKPDLHG